MRRIDSATASTDENGVGRDGFTEGGGATPATHLNADWFNETQENICRAIERQGQTLTDNDHEQLAQAIEQAPESIVDRAYVSGLTVSDGGGLNADVAAGHYVWNGRRFYYEGGSIALSASSTNYLFLGASGSTPTLYTDTDPTETNGARIGSAVTNSVGVTGVTQAAGVGFGPKLQTRARVSQDLVPAVGGGSSLGSEDAEPASPTNTRAYFDETKTIELHRRASATTGLVSKTEHHMVEHLHTTTADQSADFSIPNGCSAIVSVDAVAHREDTDVVGRVWRIVRGFRKTSGGTLSATTGPADDIWGGSTVPTVAVEASPGNQIRVRTTLSSSSQTWRIVADVKIVYTARSN